VLMSSRVCLVVSGPPGSGDGWRRETSGMHNAGEQSTTRVATSLRTDSESGSFR
jgi:hypothetical protein